ncbi:MAG: hypothetical protein ACLSFO_02710 [Anaerovoracaceae bacterium]
MAILEQCQKWNERGEYQKIIDALEAVPAEERSPEMDSELARAYNNAASVEDKELFRKALGLLLPHREYFQGDHCWNFRVAYAYFFLEQEGRALSILKELWKHGREMKIRKSLSTPATGDLCCLSLKRISVSVLKKPGKLLRI